MQEVDRKKDFRSIMSASRTGRRKKQPYAVLSVGEYARQGLARPTSPPMTQHSHAESACIALHEHDRQWSGNHRVVEGWGEGGFARVRSAAAAGRRDKQPSLLGLLPELNKSKGSNSSDNANGEPARRGESSIARLFGL